MKKKPKYTVLLGFILIIGGINIAITGESWGIPASRMPGFLTVLLGGYIIWAAIKKDFTIITEDQYLKCTNCGKIIKKEQEEDEICQRCGGKLEYLEGFFERHPDANK